jgi:hypothetical protein
MVAIDRGVQSVLSRRRGRVWKDVLDLRTAAIKRLLAWSLTVSQWVVGDQASRRPARRHHLCDGAQALQLVGSARLLWSACSIDGSTAQGKRRTWPPA